ncbi:MAG: cytochrome ubiquinol oxidase subunit I [Fimbriimonas sp.]
MTSDINSVWHDEDGKYMTTEILARLQFAFTSMFHYIFPPMSIGLGLILIIIEGIWLKTGDEKYKRMAHFWVKIFSLIFGIGVATGIVLEFEFGTNWSTYSRFVGDIFGSALAAEGIFAFFLESGFLAVLVFGWHKVSPKVHFFSTCMVALGSTFSAVWIIVANSWMQTPQGYVIRGTGLQARAEITDFWGMVFNPSSMDRLVHSVTGAWVTGAYLLISVSAYYLLKKRHTDIARPGIKIGLALASVALLFQIVNGHTSTLGVARNQPAKFAAMEGHFDSAKPLDVTVLGWVDTASGETKGLVIPGLGTTLLGGIQAKGLNDFPQEDQPNVQVVFQTFHLMVALGIGLTVLTLVAAVMVANGKLWTNRPMLTVLVWSVAIPQICNQAGWLTAELGRQPWIVYGIMRTDQGLSKVVNSQLVFSSLVLFGLLYLLLGVLFFYLLNKRIQTGPEEPTWPETLVEAPAK